jgi:hypothetical protein
MLALGRVTLLQAASQIYLPPPWPCFRLFSVNHITRYVRLLLSLSPFSIYSKEVSMGLLLIFGSLDLQLLTGLLPEPLSHRSHSPYSVSNSQRTPAPHLYSVVLQTP